ncbi:NACHT domain-containing protein [Streptomyces sp. NBC_01016]|uniref:NACHT domain-containing protein n=1 Tax=Streptomyces sp. NBC_01016 TaxID=2903720 RepID=UPI00225977DD|nr:NACHT domain-containing protein [Streptomyces sp. NBC_01016]MCX4827787.1 NACHT domain-containing protein [Streptomyces sp. NBC_01016]
MGTQNSRHEAHQDHEVALQRLSESLRRLRAERRIPVAALASRAGLSRTTASKALNGSSIPTEETVTTLARALGIDPRPLLDMRRQALPPSKPKPTVQKKELPNTQECRTKEYFEEQYARYIDNRWGKLSIIGIDINHPGRHSWPLDTAYLSLSLGATDEIPDSRDEKPGKRRPPNEIRIEQALVERRRLLIRGLAGCGKTTLLQWLAVTAARGNFPQELHHLNDCVPFLLRLRTLTRIGSLPAPSGYLSAVGCQLAGDQPAGWAHSVLSSGRALVLIDGVDEVSQVHRNETRDWLEELLASYPDNQYVVTTRPTAVNEGWLSDSGFSELAIHPMSPRDVAVFIDRWHEAAAVDVNVEDERKHLNELREDLKDAVRSQRGLAQLTTSPLLSALVCALHRARNGYLPHGRMEIYRAALAMLLDRRDRERGIEATGIHLNEHQATRLLQRLAYWMVDNGQAEISRDDAMHHLADILPNMPEVAAQGSVKQILSYLVDRSGLIRAPDVDGLDFVHRTFQDYLAANFAVEQRNFGALVNHADDDRWEDVIRMAVAHASPSDAKQLLRKLISRGDRFTANTERRHRLHLLAAACLDYAVELDPDTRQEVRSRAEAVIPPRSLKDSRSLAKVGPFILDLLPGPDDLDDIQAEAVVHTAGLLGGDQSMSVLKRFRTCTKGRVPHYLQLHWGRHNVKEYAQDILRHNPGIDHLTISTFDQITELRHLEMPPSVALEGDFGPQEIAALKDVERIQSLTIGYNNRLVDLQVLRTFPNLRRITLDICQGVKDTSALNYSSVQSLSVWKASTECLTSLPRLTNLQGFRINSDSRHLALCDFFPASHITSAYLGPMSCRTLKGISEWPTIEDFSIITHRPIEGLAELAKLPNLYSLELGGAATSNIIYRIPVMGMVRKLTIAKSDFVDCGVLVEKFPNMQEICLPSDSGPLDLAPLSNIEGLLVRAPGVSSTGEY